MANSFGHVPWWGTAPMLGIGTLGIAGVALFAVLLVALIALKGYALWYAARRDEKWWFVVMLIINTAGILELVYLIFVVKRWQKKIVEPRQ